MGGATVGEIFGEGVLASMNWASLRNLGPGLLFAGMAIGTSHLVQSTRAGAVFGLGLAAVILAANLAKYPAFRFGAQYAAATGETLISGYRRIGLAPVLFLLAVFIFAHGFAVSAISLVTAGMLKTVLGLELGLMPTIALVMLVVALFLGLGRYHLLEQVNRIFMAVLTISTLVATILVLPSIEWSIYPASAPPLDLAAFLFIVALAGWMPSPIEASIFSSLWTLARKDDAEADQNGSETTMDATVSDFNIGYVWTTLLALCFMLLGAGVMHTGGVTPEDSAPGFAAQLVALYSNALGAWAGPIVGVAALSVMFTTAITVTDGLTRALVVTLGVLKGGADNRTASGEGPRYRIALVGILVAALLLLMFFMQGFRTFIDFVTSLAFLTAPVFAYLNHRAMGLDVVGEEHKPSAKLRLWSIFSITALSAFAVAYLWLLVGRG